MSSSCGGSGWNNLWTGPLDSVLYAWTTSTGYVKDKVWYSWDWVDKRACASTPSSPICAKPHIEVPMSFLVRSGSGLVRLAGLSGAAAVALGAYGAHNFTPEKAEYQRVYQVANMYHFMHTLALLGTPLCRRPFLTGTLFVAGMTIFCGTTYYHALTEERSLRKFTPYGGILLILGWLSMIL